MPRVSRLHRLPNIWAKAEIKRFDFSAIAERNTPSSSLFENGLFFPLI